MLFDLLLCLFGVVCALWLANLLAHPRSPLFRPRARRRPVLPGESWPGQSAGFVVV